MPFSRLQRLFLPLLALAMLLPGPAMAASSGAEFLLLEPGARAAAVAGAFSAAAAQLDSLRYNPAGFSGQKGLGAAVAHVNGAADWNHDWVALGLGLGPLSLGGEVLVSNMAPFELFDAAGRSAGMATVGSQNAMLAVAARVSRWLHAGAGFRMFTSHLHTYESRGMAADLGLQARARVQGQAVQAGVAVQNLGSQTAYLLVADPLPMLVRGGLQGDLALDKDFHVQPHADAVWFQDPSRPLEARLGMEAQFYGQAFLRGGWLRAGSFQQLSFGLGFRWEMLSLDYCFQPGSELGNSHLVELQLATGR